MPLDTRFLHWLQAADEELLSRAGEVVADADEETPAPPRLILQWDGGCLPLAIEDLDSCPQGVEDDA